MQRFLIALLSAAACAEQVFEDSPALTKLWQATSSGSTEAFISTLLENREYAQHRAADGRGPMFWAFEFKNVDTLALLMELGVEVAQEDVEGKKPREFFTGTEEEMSGEQLPTHAMLRLSLSLPRDFRE